jgi:hypothetical protein
VGLVGREQGGREGTGAGHRQRQRQRPDSPQAGARAGRVAGTRSQGPADHSPPPTARPAISPRAPPGPLPTFLTTRLTPRSARLAHLRHLSHLPQPVPPPHPSHLPHLPACPTFPLPAQPAPPARPALILLLSKPWHSHVGIRCGICSRFSIGLNAYRRVRRGGRRPLTCARPQRRSSSPPNFLASCATRFASKCTMAG